jgi:hypothetical protein
MDLNKILYKYIPIKGTNLNKIDLFSETGMYFTPSFLELVEQNKDFIIYYMEKLCGISKEEHIYVSPHIYRVEKEQKGTCLHNDFNHNVQNNFESVNELEKGGKILYYHLALTDVRHDTNALIVYPRTCHELPTYAYAFKYLTENNINKDIDFLLKAFYLSQKSAQAFPARLYLLNQYYKAKYKEDIQGLKAEVDAGEGVFFNSLCLHSSHVPHQEDIPRISLVIKIKTITKKNAGVTYFDYVSNALSKIFGISYKDFINILYDNKEPNTKNHLEMLIRGNSDKESNITISNMKNFFNKTASFFNEPEYIVSENFLESLK